MPIKGTLARKNTCVPLSFSEELFTLRTGFSDSKIPRRETPDTWGNWDGCVDDLTWPEADTWVRSFERSTKTNWNVRKTYPQLERLHRKDYVCHLHNFHNRPLKGRKSQSRFKFTNCSADLTVKIKPVTKATRLRYKWVRDGMPAQITINFRHNHSVTSSEMLSFRKLDPAVRRMFAGYFSLGMSAAAAAKYHRQRIETDPDIGNPAIALEDAARNPRRSTVSYLYTLWRECKLDEMEESVVESQTPVAKLYNEEMISKDSEESNDVANVKPLKPTNTSDAWQAIADKVNTCLKHLAPYDQDVLGALEVMSQTFSRVKTHKELVTFLQSPTISLALPSFSSPTVHDNLPAALAGMRTSALKSSADATLTASVPIVSNTLLLAPEVDAGHSLIEGEQTSQVASLLTKSTTAIRQRQNGLKRSYVRRTTKCVPAAGSLSSSECFDPLSTQLKRSLPVVQQIENAPANTVATAPSLPCYSVCHDFHTLASSYLPTVNWDYL